jgi:hypothetical protein
VSVQTDWLHGEDSETFQIFGDFLLT